MDILFSLSQYLYLFVSDPNQKKRHTNIMFWWRYGCSLLTTVSTTFSIAPQLTFIFCNLTLQRPSYLPNKAIPKKAPQKYLFVMEIFMLTVVNSEQDMLDFDMNHCCFWQSKMVDRWIDSPGPCSQRSAMKGTGIKRDIAISCCSLSATVTRHNPKWKVRYFYFWNMPISERRFLHLE